MDPTQARRVARRDQGVRRQRRVTQAVALGATGLVAVFGWAFAQPDTATADSPAPPPQSTQDDNSGPGRRQDRSGSNSGSDRLVPSDQAPGASDATQGDTRSGGS